jgi:hypothetical protein
MSQLSNGNNIEVLPAAYSSLCGFGGGFSAPLLASTSAGEMLVAGAVTEIGELQMLTAEELSEAVKSLPVFQNRVAD